MSTDDIHALIAQCKAAKDTGQWARLWAALTPDVIAELARDAARFQWLLDRHGETEADPDTADVWLHFIGWSGEVRTADIRAAIDATMDRAP